MSMRRIGNRQTIYQDGERLGCGVQAAGTLYPPSAEKALN